VGFNILGLAKGALGAAVGLVTGTLTHTLGAVTGIVKTTVSTAESAASGASGLGNIVNVVKELGQTLTPLGQEAGPASATSNPLTTDQGYSELDGYMHDATIAGIGIAGFFLTKKIPVIGGLVSKLIAFLTPLFLKWEYRLTHATPQIAVQLLTATSSSPANSMPKGSTTPVPPTQGS
jgi:hypothetical protein